MMDVPVGQAGLARLRRPALVILVVPLVAFGIVIAALTLAALVAASVVVAAITVTEGAFVAAIEAGMSALVGAASIAVLVVGAESGAARGPATMVATATIPPSFRCDCEPSYAKHNKLQ